MSTKEKMLRNYRMHNHARYIIISSFIFFMLAAFTIWVFPDKGFWEYIEGALLYGMVASALTCVIFVAISLHTGKQLFQSFVPLADKLDEFLKQETDSNQTSEQTVVVPPPGSTMKVEIPSNSEVKK